MSTFKAFTRGWAATLSPALALAWLFYALVSAFVAMPAVAMLLGFLDTSRLASKLVEHFDPAWLGDLMPSVGMITSALTPAAIVAAAITWIGALTLAGGFLALLAESPRRFSLFAFFGAGGRNFWRLFRLSAWGLICYALALAIVGVPERIVKARFEDGMEFWPMGVARIVTGVLSLLAVSWISTVLDYAKVRLVCDDTKGAMKALLRAFGFVHRNFRLTMGVWLLNALLFGVASLIYLQVSNSVTAVSMWAIALMIVWQQAYVLFRTAQRFAAWGAAIEVYSAMTPAPRPPIEVSVASDPAPIIQNDAIPDDELEEPAASQATELEGGR